MADKTLAVKAAEAETKRRQLLATQQTKPKAAEQKKETKRPARKSK